MAASPKVAVRVDGALLEWLDGYAAARGASRSAVVNAALASFRELARGGVPDLELAPADGRSGRQGKVDGAGSPSSRDEAAPVASLRPGAGAAPVRLEDRVLELDRVRFGSRASLVGARRTIRMGRVQVAGKPARDPGMLVDPSAVTV